MTVTNVTAMLLPILRTIGAIFLSIFYALEALLRCLVPRSYLRYDITGKVTLITGAGSGIGRRVAQNLAKRGAIIVTWDVNTAGNEETVRLIQEEGGKCSAYTVDLCDRHAIYKVAQKVKNEVGKVDILVNNAGIVSGRSFMESPDEMVLKTFDVNVLSNFWTTKAFLPAMMAENSGHIVTIASVAGKFGLNKLVDYCSSKFAAVGFDETLRLELYIEGYTGIDTTVVCPYYINTGMFDGVESRLIPILEQDYVADEIADAILMKRRQIVLPGICRVMIAVKGIMHVNTDEYLSYALGINDTMDHFVGREKQKVS